jgi:hypothetical protein
MNEVAVFGAEVLIGQFAGLVLAGRAVWKSIIAPARDTAPAAATAGGAS